MPPLVAPPVPPEAITPTRAVEAIEITVSEIVQGRTEATTDSNFLPEGIDYSSVSFPDPAPRDAFVDPLDGPEPFDD